MATSQTEIQINELSNKIKKLEEIPEAIKEINKKIEALVTNEAFTQKVTSIEVEIKKQGEEIEKLKPSDNTERARVENLIKNRLWIVRRKISLWEKAKIFALVITILLILAIAYILKMDVATIASILKMNAANPTDVATIKDSIKIDVTVGLSVLAALFALLYLSLSLGNAKNLQKDYKNIEELEKLEADFTNPTMTPTDARTKYNEIIKIA
jgi:hypothetical protein